MSATPAITRSWAPSRATPAASPRWCSVPTGTPWPPPALTRPPDYGMSTTPANPPSWAPSPATPTRSPRWPSAPTDTPWPPPAPTTPPDYGTPASKTSPLESAAPPLPSPQASGTTTCPAWPGLPAPLPLNYPISRPSMTQAMTNRRICPVPSTPPRPDPWYAGGRPTNNPAIQDRVANVPLPICVQACCLTSSRRFCHLCDSRWLSCAEVVAALRTHTLRGPWASVEVPAHDHRCWLAQHHGDALTS